MECPKGLLPGTCCGITTGGAVYVQRLMACRDDVHKGARVEIRKGGPITMAEKPDRSQVRKALWDLISQTADRLQRESRQTLSKAAALTAAMEQYPTLATAYTDAVKRGDPPSEVFSEAPVAKAGAAHEQLFATITKRAEALAARTGTPIERAMADVFAADPASYERYRAAVTKRSTPSTS
jgi:hypothetical protein